MSAPPITESHSSSEKASLKAKDKTFASKRSSEYYDPCQEAANKSIKCMNRNNGDRDMCQDYFQAYRDCKKEWMERRKQARAAEQGGGSGWFS